MNFHPYYFDKYPPAYKIIEEEKEDVSLYGEFFSPELALKHGNTFRKKYLPYKNYLPKLDNLNSLQEELERKIQMYSLISHDLKLYLDIYPHDLEVFRIYQKYIKKYQSLVDEYQEKYHTIDSEDSKFDTLFSWVKTSGGK